MRSLLLSSFLLVYSALLCYGQSTNNQIRFVPSSPEREKAVDFFYSPKDSALLAASRIYCLIYITGIDELNQAEVVNFPKVLEVNMTKENTSWKGSIEQIPTFATCLVAVFTDSLGHIDNNNGEGYWTPITESGHVVPGALSGIADMHAGAWDPGGSYRLKKDLTLARRLFEEDFKLHPEVKRNYIRAYLNTLDVNNTDTKKLFLATLDEYSRYPDLTEWDLLNGISGNYVKVNDIKSAEKFKKLVFEKFPRGSWAIQTNSLKVAMQISQTEDITKQQAIYLKFISEFGEPYPDEFTRRVMTGRRGRLLAEMASNFSENNSMEQWKREVENLKDDEFIIYAYSRAAGYIIDESRQNSQDKESTTQPEKNLIVYPINLKNNKLADAEELASQAAIWWEQKLINAPRRWIDRPFYTDLQIRLAREGRMAEFLDQKGQLEAMQNKFSEAVKTLEDAAVKWGKRNNPEINEHYIEVLVKTHKLEQALKEMQSVIALGKSTKRINELYTEHKNSDTRIVDLKRDYYKELKKRLNESAVNEPAPHLSLLDRNGNPIDSAAFQGKIIVLDFWASWCPPCMEGNSILEEVADKYTHDKDVVFLFVNVDVYRSRVLTIMKGKPNQLNYVLDKDNQTIRRFLITALPSKVVINKHGKVKFKVIGLSGGRQEQIDEINSMIEMARNSN